MTAALAGVFALIALGLAAVGVYGMVAVLVVQRTHEFGVRVALGAPPGDVGRRVLAQGALHAAAGIAVGLGVWLGVSRVLRSVVYGVTLTDPFTLAGSAALLLAAAVAASYLPARRACPHRSRSIASERVGGVSCHPEGAKRLRIFSPGD